jgi:DinB family protein
MNKHEVIEAIVLERAKLLDAIDRLGADAETRPVTDGGWTAKDTLAHCIHWSGQIAFGLGAAMHPPAWVEAVGDERPSGDEWNRGVVAHYRPMPLAIVRRDFEQVVGAILERVRKRDDVDYDARANTVFPWIGSDVPVWKAIAGETWEHWPEHSADLERALARAR